MPSGGAMVLRRVLSEEIDPRSGFLVGEAMRRPLRVVYADHSRFEHLGVAVGGCRHRADGGVRAGPRSKTKMKRRVGCLRQI